jgi:nicotinamidase-related amidase
MKDALLLVDVVNDFRHEDGEALLTSFRARQPRLVQALERARGSIPVVYANDDWGRWDGNAPQMVREAIASGLGGELVAEIAPHDAEPIVLKPRYSAFDSTPLEILLGSLDIERLLLAGMATEMCVTQTAIAARELGYKVTVLAGACACVDDRLEQIALAYLADVVGVHIER